MSDKRSDLDKGKILIAEPLLGDPNFNRTVVFLTDYNTEGSVGFVLNRITDFDLSELLFDFPHFDAKICEGGPVNQDNLFFLHSRADLLDGSQEIIPGVYWGGDFNQLKAAVMNGHIKTNEIRFFLGYSGWSAGQLEDELETQSWQIAPANAALVFNENPESIWPQIIASLGGDYPLWINTPADPSLN